MICSLEPIFISLSSNIRRVWSGGGGGSIECTLCMNHELCNKSLMPPPDINAQLYGDTHRINITPGWGMLKLVNNSNTESTPQCIAVVSVPDPYIHSTGCIATPERKYSGSGDLPVDSVSWRHMWNAIKKATSTIWLMITTYSWSSMFCA